MPRRRHPEPLVKKMVKVTARQWDALEGEAAKLSTHSVSEVLRNAIDRWFGFDDLTIDPKANERKEVA